MSEAQQKTKRTRRGRVVSNKADKTVTVLLERQLKHPMYGKYLTRSSKVHAHDEKNDCRMGDTVDIVECRPISKLKNWRVLDVVERADEV